MNNTDAFTAQQTLAYLQGRKAFNISRTNESNPYVASSYKAQAWMNGFLDAEQGEITRRVCEIRK